MGLENVQLKFVETIDDVYEFKRWLSQDREILGVDTETGGLEFWNNSLRLLQFGDLETGWAIPVDRWAGIAHEVFTKYTGEFVMHNAIFDVTFLEEKLGVQVPWSRMNDTRLMGHLFDPHNGVSLKGMSARFINPRAAVGQEVLTDAMKQQKWTWETVPTDFKPYWSYGALDAVLTAHLHHILRPQIRDKFEEAYQLEIAVSRVIMQMQRRGMRIDLQYTKKKGDELLAFVDLTHAYVEKEYGIRSGSNAQVTKKLIELGVELTERTPRGGWKLDKEVLANIEHPLAEHVLNSRKAQKIHSTYMVNFLEMANGDRLHPSINQLGAKTGRMSVDRPALQTLPRGTVVRDCFIPSEDCILVASDFDQIEMRLLAHFAREESMIAAILSGDLHTETARRVYGDPTIEKKDPRRQLAKNAGFAKVYGAGMQKFALTAGVTEPQAREFLDGYDAQFPGVRQFQEDVERLALARLASEGEAYVTSPVGRKHIAEHGGLYKLVNYLIQGTAADVLKQRLVQLDLAGLGEYMLLPVHDEIVFDVPCNEVREIEAAIKETMPDRTSFAVPLTVDVTTNLLRWGDKYRE